jgi:hypothetical protein
VLPPAFPQFVNDPDPNNDPTFNDPNYLFNNGNSLFAGPGVEFGTALDPGTGFQTEFGSLGDVATSLSGDVAITSSNNHLADLLVDSTASGTTNPGGDRYIITLDLANSHFYQADDVTPITGITVNPGTIIVTANSPAAAVPEPSTLVLALISAAVPLGWWLRSRHRAGRPPLAP